MASPKINSPFSHFSSFSPFSPGSPSKKASKILKDMITTPYERVLNILHDLKLYLSKKSDGDIFVEQLDWIISVVSSRSLYDYQLNNNQNEVIEKYQKEIPGFKHFMEYLSEYNGQVNLVKKYSDLINKTAQILEDKHSVSFEQLGLQLPSKNYKRNNGVIPIMRNSIFKRALTCHEVHKYFVKSKSEEKKSKKKLKDIIGYKKKRNRGSICYEIKDEGLENSNIKLIEVIKSNSNSLNNSLEENLMKIENNIKNIPKNNKIRRFQSSTKALDKIFLSPVKHFEPIFNIVELEKKLAAKSFNLNQIMKPDFNIHELRVLVGYNFVLPCVGKVIFHYFNINDKIINLNKLDKFLTTISNKYNHNVLYHNAVHAADVCQSIATYINNSNFEEKAFTNINDILSLIIACLGHDLGHPGLNANFLINSYDIKAIIYNDISPLENFHSSYLFKISRLDECNIFDKFSDLDFRTLRKRIISEILATDMAVHAKVLGVIKSKLINNPDKILISKDSKNIFEEQQSLFDFAVHCADISHNAKSYHISLRWVELLTEEMWNQGDKERKMNLPVSFLCDRNNYDVPKSQVGFIKAFIIPIFDVLTEIFPTLHYLRENAYNNLKKWDQLNKEKRKKGWSLEKRKRTFRLEESNESSSSIESNDLRYNNDTDNVNDDNNSNNNEKDYMMIINLLAKRK